MPHTEKKSIRTNITVAVFAVESGLFEICTVTPLLTFGQVVTFSVARTGGGGLAGFSTSLVMGGAFAGGGGFPGFSVLTDDGVAVALEWDVGVALVAGFGVDVASAVFPGE